MSAPTRELPRMLARYREEIAPALLSEFEAIWRGRIARIDALIDQLKE